MQEIEHDVGSMDGSTDTVRAAAPFLVPIIRQAYDALVAANSPLVDPATHPTLATAIDVLDEWNAYLADLSQIYAGRSLRRRRYSPSRGQPGMSIFFQWWYALKRDLWGGGAGGSPAGAFVGTVNFGDHDIDGNDYVGETTYNMFLHLLEGAAAGVPQHFTGDYFGGHRDELIVQAVNRAIALLAGTAPLPQMGYGLCSGGSATVPGFGTPDPHAWGWQPAPSLDFDCLDNFADPLLALGTQPTTFGRAPEENRSTYMQALEVGRRRIVGANVMPPGPVGVHPAPGRWQRPGGSSTWATRRTSSARYKYKPMVLK